MKARFAALILCILTIPALGQSVPALKISANQNYLLTQENEPFFWLGGTAWELIHRLDREEVDLYLNDRAEKGFTVIQCVVLAELDGINTANAYGWKPLIDGDPTRLNESYFEHVDYVIQKAGELGLYIALLPSWGDKFSQKWGKGPEIFSPENAEIYAALLAERYLSKTNLIWVLGGDRIPENDTHYKIIRAMAKGIRKTDTLHLISYHPVGARIASDFFDEKWLDIDMYQSGHSRTAKEYSYLVGAKKSTVIRPVVNGEARYENIPDRFWENSSGKWLDAADVRVSAYWSMIAGAAGYTYGCNDIWQMYDYRREPVISARTDWDKALNLPGSFQMGYMKNIFQKFPWQSMVYNPALILNDNPENESYMVSAIGENKDFIFVYSPRGGSVKIDVSELETEKIKAYWFNPRSGTAKLIGEFMSNEPFEAEPWAEGRGSDFLLILLTTDFPFTLSGLNN